MGDSINAEAKGSSEFLKPMEIIYNGKTYDITREGLAEILTPQQAPKVNGNAGESNAKSGRKNSSTRANVFYNPIQQYNRDLSVLAIRAFSENFAAVKLARHERRQQHPEGSQKRGTKRKRRGAQESTKRKKAEGEDGPVGIEKPTEVESEFLNDVGTEGPRKDNDNMLDSTDREGIKTVVDEPKVDTEHGEKPLDGLDRGQKESETPHAEENHGQPLLDVDLGSSDTPNRPKNSHLASPLPSFRILDALSATGLRALRYAKEIPLATSLIANDLSSSASASIKINVAHNDLASKITTTTSDALDHMYSTMSRAQGRMPQPYHVIDLDPYGTAAPFLDAAVQAVIDGGLLCVTCTDAGVFASTGYPEKTFSQYGGLSLKGAHAHEAGLRLILNAIATTAARYGIAIEPLLSLSIDFYIRVFVRVHKSPAEVKFLASKTMIVYQCDSGCGSWNTQLLARAKQWEARNGETVYKFTRAVGPSAGTTCEHCGFKTHLAGPMWGGALHNPFFVQRILDMLPELDKEVYPTIPRLEGMLTMALEENLDDPWALSAAGSKQQSPAANASETETSTATAAAAAPVLKGAEATTTNDKSSNPPRPNLSSSGDLPQPIPALPAAYRITHPFFIHPPSLARALNTTTPSDASLRGALLHLGYLTSRSHTKPGSIITNAPFDVIWEIMREWARRNSKSSSQPQSGPKIAPNTAGAGIMRNDRSKRDVRLAKAEVETRISGVESVEDLKRELEAALYRLGQGQGPATTAAAEGNPTTALSSSSKPVTATVPASSSTSNNNNTNNPPPPPPPKSHPPTSTSDGEADSPVPPPPTSKSIIHLSNLNIHFDEQLGRADAGLSSGSGIQQGGGGKKNDGKKGRGKKMVRYQLNPRENWGPLGRARG